MGLVLTSIVFFFIYINNYNTQNSLKVEVGETGPLFGFESFDSYVISCINKEAELPIKVLGINGGTLQQLSDYRFYNKTRYRYLGKKGSTNRDFTNIILTRQEMEIELEEYLKLKLDECINLDVFRKQGFVVNERRIKVDAIIGTDDVLVNLDYPVSLKKGGNKKDFTNFFSRIDIPLGKLYDLSIQIINFEAIDGYFDQEEWMKEHNLDIMVNKNKPYPDIIYTLIKKTKKEDYDFNFAIQGKETMDNHKLITSSLGDLGCCYNEYDNNCFANSLRTSCENKPDSYFQEGINNCQCSGRTIFNEIELCNGEECKDCDYTWDYNSQEYVGEWKKHGESWCVYDSVIGDGLDYVGSRHYKHICIDGEEYVEECRDYREEICVEGFEDTNFVAECRPNRWRSCFSQGNRANCKDTNLRDCSWNAALVDTNIRSYGLQRDKMCYPAVPPGFRHWNNGGGDVCSAGSEWRYCDGYNCPDSWVDAVARLCYSLGDCGNFRNVADKISYGGYTNTDNRERDFLLLDSGLIANGLVYSLMLPMSTREQSTIRTDAFNNLGYSDDDRVLAEQQWYDDATGWVGTSGGGGSTPNVEYVVGTGTCSTWKAPNNNNDCEICNDFKFKPCTEYKCKSLGNCGYMEVNGIGICGNINTGGRYETLGRIGLIPGTNQLIYDLSIGQPDINLINVDNQKPNVLFDRIIGIGYTTSDINFLGNNGVMISPNVIDRIRFRVKTNEPTSCSLIHPLSKLFPISRWFDIGDKISSIDQDKYLIDLRVDDIKEDYQRLLNISNNWGFGDDIIRLVNTANSMGQMRNFEISDSSLITPLIVNIRIGRYPLFIECSDISGNEGSTVVIVPVDP